MAALHFLKRWLLAAFALLLAAGAALAQDVLPVPPLSGRVAPPAGIARPREKST